MTNPRHAGAGAAPWCIHCGAAPVAMPYKMFCSDSCHAECLRSCGSQLQVTDEEQDA